MLIEKVVSNNNVIYSVELSDEKTRQYLETLGVDLIVVIRSELERQLLELERKRLDNILKQYGYNSLGDVQLYASRNDSEAQAILNFYTNSNGNGYDDLIWDWIDNTLPNYQTVDELLAIDIKAVEERIYQQALQNNPLP